MRRATTPTLEIELDEPIECAWFRVALAQRCGTLIVRDQRSCELSEDGRTVTLTLTQEETVSLVAGYDLRVQLRFGDGLGAVCATDIAEIPVGEILDEEVV